MLRRTEPANWLDMIHFLCSAMSLLPTSCVDAPAASLLASLPLITLSITFDKIS